MSPIPRRSPGWPCSAVGLLMILVALVSPVDELGQQLMLMHMLQHILLLDVAPILLILGLTKVLLRPATRRAERDRAARRLPRPSGGCGDRCTPG